MPSAGSGASPIVDGAGSAGASPSFWTIPPGLTPEQLRLRQPTAGAAESTSPAKTLMASKGSAKLACKGRQLSVVVPMLDLSFSDGGSSRRSSAQTNTSRRLAYADEGAAPDSATSPTPSDGSCYDSGAEFYDAASQDGTPCSCDSRISPATAAKLQQHDGSTGHEHRGAAHSLLGREHSGDVNLGSPFPAPPCFSSTSPLRPGAHGRAAPPRRAAFDSSEADMASSAFLTARDMRESVRASANRFDLALTARDDGRDQAASITARLRQSVRASLKELPAPAPATPTPAATREQPPAGGESPGGQQQQAWDYVGAAALMDEWAADSDAESLDSFCTVSSMTASETSASSPRTTPDRAVSPLVAPSRLATHRRSGSLERRALNNAAAAVSGRQAVPTIDLALCRKSMMSELNEVLTTRRAEAAADSTLHGSRGTPSGGTSPVAKGMWGVAGSLLRSALGKTPEGDR